MHGTHPQGTDETLLTKLHASHATNKNYLKPRAEVRQVFGLNHFAGVVFYEVRGFLEKNRDSFSNDLLALVGHSSNEFLFNLFADEVKMVSHSLRICVG